MSCSSDNNTYNNDIRFSNEMSFDEFRFKLVEYSKKKSFPNIDD